MERLYQTYQDSVEFLLIYIREAHPDSVLTVEQDGRQSLLKVAQTETLESRVATAQTCAASLHLSIPTLVDKPDNAVNAAYAGWPDRLVVVGLDGKIAYYGSKGPAGFKPQDVEKWLRESAAAPTAAGLQGDVVVAAAGKFNRGRPAESLEQEPLPEKWTPRSERWQIHWTPTDLEDYTRQLDFFKIELAAGDVGKPLIDYASKVSQPRPDSRQAASAIENRMYLVWPDPAKETAKVTGKVTGKGEKHEQASKVKDFDKAILARAGVATADRVLLQFLPLVVEDGMAWIEKENAERLGYTHFEAYRKTIFGVRPIGREYELYVEKQEFREPPR